MKTMTTTYRVVTMSPSETVYDNEDQRSAAGDAARLRAAQVKRENADWAQLRIIKSVSHKMEGVGKWREESCASVYNFKNGDWHRVDGTEIRGL